LIDLPALTAAILIAVPAGDSAGAAADTSGVRSAAALETPADSAHAGPQRHFYDPLKGVLSDVWYVASSPARINRSTVKWGVAFLAGTALLYAYDQEISDAFQRSRGNGVYDAVIDAGEVIDPIGIMGHTIPYYVGAAVVGWAIGYKPLHRIPLEVVESHLIAGGIRNGSKLLLGRRRPTENFGPRRFEFNGGTSFPSGHTSVAFEIATILSRHIDRTPVSWTCYALATTVALQRIDSRGHWPSDVVLSAVTGTLVARIVVHRNEERRLRLEPRVDATGRLTGVNLSARF
jgi:membrane-associated phospholipid phosphatase